VRPAAFAFAVANPLAIPSRLQLGDQARLLELGDGAEHLADQNGSWRVFSEKSGAEAGMRSIPNPFSMSWPASWTAKSRAKRSGLSTMIVRIPLPAIRCSMAGSRGARSPDQIEELGLDLM
jgi:hypothetical protein